MNKKLYFFTNTFPYGLGTNWQKYELDEFTKYFDDITIVPFTDGGNLKPLQLSETVTILEPLNLVPNYLYLNPKNLKWKDLLRLISRRSFFYFKEFLTKGVFLRKEHLISWIQSSLNIQSLLSHPAIKKIMREQNKNVVWYFYWGRGICDIINFVNKKRFGKIVVKMHRYDLFEDQNEGYIPFRKSLLDKATDVISICQAGVRHLIQLYPKAQSNIQLMRNGTITKGFSKPSKDRILRIVSCSYLTPVKRVQIILNALHLIKFAVEWTHLGDGPLMDTIKDEIRDLSSNIKCILPGMVKPDAIYDYYLQNPVDLFINVSASEGIPASIKEAFSAGIPAFATNVGGNSEIVDDSVGKLLPAQITPEKLANELQKFYNLSPSEKVILRKNAFNRFNTQYNADTLAKEFARFLSN